MLILVRRSQICNSLIVSTLTSFEKLPATVPDLANRPRQLVFLTPLNSQLNDFLNEIHQIARLEPSIVERIDQDLDLHAKKKKLLRLIDAQFLAGQTPDLPKLQLQLRELKLDEIELEDRPAPYRSLYRLSFPDAARVRSAAAKISTLGCCWRSPSRSNSGSNHLGLELPAASTLSENLNAVSNQTRGLIHQVQLRLHFTTGSG